MFSNILKKIENNFKTKLNIGGLEITRKTSIDENNSLDEAIKRVKKNNRKVKVFFSLWNLEWIISYNKYKWKKGYFFYFTEKNTYANDTEDELIIITNKENISTKERLREIIIKELEEYNSNIFTDKKEKKEIKREKLELNL